MNRGLRPGQPFEPTDDETGEAMALFESARPLVSAQLVKARAAGASPADLLVMVTMHDESPAEGERFECFCNVVDRQVGATMLRRLRGGCELLGEQFRSAPPPGCIWAVVGFSSGHAFSMTVPLSYLERGLA